MIKLTVQTDMRVVQDFTTLLPRHIRNAQRSAVRTTTTLIRKEVEEKLAQASGLPTKLLKQYRIKQRITGNAQSDFETGIVWIGYNPVKARHVGKLEQAERGAFAGVYYFQGGFVATMKNGLTSIFKRRGKKRLPIDEQKVQLAQTPAIQQAAAQLAEQELYKRFVAKLTEYESRLSGGNHA